MYVEFLISVTEQVLHLTILRILITKNYLFLKTNLNYVFNMKFNYFRTLGECHVGPYTTSRVYILLDKGLCRDLTKAKVSERLKRL